MTDLSRWTGREGVGEMANEGFGEHSVATVSANEQSAERLRRYDEKHLREGIGEMADRTVLDCGCESWEANGATVTMLCDEHAEWDKTNEELEREGGAYA